MARKKWSELSNRQKTAVLVAGSVQVSLLLAALVDIYRRPAEEIRGSKWMWTAVSLINFVGPISYIALGRRR
jgi:Phospholipase_D-nuclease N-terminal